MQINKYNSIRVHLIFWVLYYFLEVYLDFLWSRYQFPKLEWYLRLRSSVILELGYLMIKIPLAYLLLYVANKVTRSVIFKYTLYILIFSGAILIHRFYCHDILYPYIHHIPETVDGIIPMNLLNMYGILSALMDLMFMTGLFFGIEIAREKMILNEQLSGLKAEKLDHELRMLKAQINPHFLFNSLNNIYGLALKKSDKTPEVILQLSKIMRYNIYEAAQAKIPIGKDVENMKDFIQIQKIRYHHLDVQFNENIDNPSQEISPLILIQFVENAFKHGASESIGNSFIKINIWLKEEILHFEIENSKEDRVREDSTQIGLKNISRQLELLYPKHQLMVENSSDLYKVKLTIDFTHEQ
ncbi:sensor histidine kinase [Elizabethkingia meningoseptica]|uniref:sensor histidine kinase n=1 Tax=Elizabethkingia meningoseptica TaxID=238 RepID=UPI0023AF7EB0|nr:histidine kinase [Elizabethkingia meningoseptica]MDE5492663.1 histidine kinase [Elizabethkingia meningoseptica]